MTDPNRQQRDIRSFFGQNASKTESTKASAPVAKKSESHKSDDNNQKMKPAKTSTAKRAPAKSKEKPASGKKGVAVTRKKTAKTAKAKQPKKKPVKRSRKKRSRDEEEEYDSDFVTSDDSESEESSEDELEPKQKGRKRIICSDGESDVEVIEARSDEPEEKRLVNQTITDFVSAGSQKPIERKETRSAAPLKKQEMSSESFFGASSKPKLVKASSNPPSEVLLKESIPKHEELPDDYNVVDDSKMITAQAIVSEEDEASPEVTSSIDLKENIAPSDIAMDSAASLPPSVTEAADVDSIMVNGPVPAPAAPAAKPAPKKWFPGQQRAAPKHLGQKEIPKGEPNCLAGKRFVITGVLESLERDPCIDLIRSLGGAVTTAVSGKTTHLLIGEEPRSEKKIEEAKKKKIEILDEDGLFRLISTCKSVPMAEVPTIEIKLQSGNQSRSSVNIDSPSLMWVDKYKPATSEDLCANPGVIGKLRQFLNKWPNTEEGKHAVLLSGPPGIGKSSSAAICAKEAGYNVVELNASTARSKKALHEHVKELLQCHSISEYFGGNLKPKKQNLHKTVLIMDEVDGMSGGDRGGMQELYSLIKTTKVPIICICNDRASPKVKTLANYCIDLRFRRPMANQVAQRLLSIAKGEGLNVDITVLTKLVETTRGDIRQMLNTMQLWRTSSQTITFEDAMNAPTKDFENSPFDLAPELFRSISPHQTDWMASRMDVYFSDPSLIPLMVQSNYLNCIPQLTPAETSQSDDRRQICYLERYAKAACSMSDGDIVETNIRGRQSWSLMPVHAVMSSVAPGIHISGRLQGRVEFPQWLGKNATYGKNVRLLSELHSHVMSKLLGTSAQDLNLDYLPALRRRIVNSLTEHGTDGIDETVRLMNRYNLIRSDLDIIFELGEPISGKVTLNTKVKTALTRALTQRSTAVVSARKGRAVPVESEPPLPQDDEIADSYEDLAAEEIEEKPEEPPVPTKPTKSKAATSKRKSTAKASSSSSKKSRSK